ncbi:hypothetical protein L6164_013460 [Bauhinia variegata]|uniref:Uncharacterized protein n=1 Tax=Bauhinia variegata TaxID=167791 RepID=A0ACB9NEE0_BAUVA|nr:hypothetical protein L6164_013460 [Bauhinia variegata]
MPLSILELQHRGCVLSLFDEGVVNDEFNRIYSLKKTREPDCVVKLIEEYIVDADTIISELSSLIDTPNVDVTKLGALARKLEEKSQRIGAEHMRAASADLIQAYGQIHKANFSRALAGVSNEFIYTKMKFEYFLKLEQKIIGERGEGSQT